MDDPLGEGLFHEFPQNQSDAENRLRENPNFPLVDLDVDLDDGARYA
tara:strand:- start:803 stop:943 length:141 start_codon:yes stop_codon:yes gene_type:complete